MKMGKSINIRVISSVDEASKYFSNYLPIMPIEISKKNNPDLIIAQLEYEQSKKDTLSAKSDLAPSASLSFDSCLLYTSPSPRDS